MGKNLSEKRKAEKIVFDQFGEQIEKLALYVDGELQQIAVDSISVYESLARKKPTVLTASMFYDNYALMFLNQLLTLRNIRIRKEVTDYGKKPRR